MIADIRTVLWKEFREIFMQKGNLHGGLPSLLILLFLIGVFLPLQTGPQWLSNPIFLLLWSWLPLFLVMGVVADAIAGERERHTLETLLASRISERGILFGKLAAGLLYGWVTAVAAMLLAPLTLDLAGRNSGLLFYPLPVFLSAVVVGFLSAFFMSAAGILVSLSAESVRQAYQRLSLGFMILWLVPILTVQVIPASIKIQIMASMSTFDPTQILPYVLAVLILIDAALLSTVLARFNRQRLILD
jgi:ABC-2 type transport system permease protein